jgi:O-antigen/teichoic acid export membrane protein
MNRLILSKIISIKDVSKDMIYNLLATAISTGVMQLVLFPQFALRLDDHEYGELLTIMGIINVITLSLGNNLFNVRIVVNEKYNESGLKGDFQILLFISFLIALIMIISAGMYFKWTTEMFMGTMLVTAFSVLYSYYLVAFRININFKKNLYANIIMALVFVIGAFTIIKIILWPWIFVLSYILCIIYIASTSDIILEPIAKTKLFWSTTKVTLLFFISGIIGTVTMYLDRFIIFPILGGSSVSYFTTACFFSKSISLILLPITSVLLSYISSNKLLMTNKRFIVTNWILIIISILFLFFSLTFGKFVTGLLYPTLIDASKPYLLLASIGVIIGISGSFNGIVVLAKAPSFWQVVISTEKLICYLLFCLIFVKMYGLYGMCVGIIITNTICFITNFIVGNYYLKKTRI